MTSDPPTADNGHKPGGPDANRRPGLGLFFELGFRLVISVGIGLGAGVLLDNRLHTSPIFTLVGMVIGIGAAMYTIWTVASEGVRR